MVRERKRSLSSDTTRFRRLEDNYGVLSEWTLDKIKEASKGVVPSEGASSDSSVLAKFLTKVVARSNRSI